MTLASLDFIFKRSLAYLWIASRPLASFLKYLTGLSTTVMSAPGSPPHFGDDNGGAGGWLLIGGIFRVPGEPKESALF